MPVLNQCDKWREEYTKLLKREKKADDYLNNHAIPIGERQRWIPEHDKLLKELDLLLSKIRHYSPDNIRFGWPELIGEKPIETDQKKDISKIKLF